LFDALLYGRIEETNTNVDISLLREVDHKTLAKDKLVRNNLMYDKLGMAPQYDYTPPRLDHAREARMLSDYIFYTPESRELIMQNHHNRKPKFNTVLELTRLDRDREAVMKAGLSH